MKERKTNGQTIGFFGLGNMGLPIAHNLLNAGYQLRIFNRTKEKGAPLAEQGAELVDSPNEVAEKGGVVFSMLADDDAVRSVSVKDTDFLRRLGPGGIHVSMSTISPETARQLAEQHSEYGVSYIGSPVVGGRIELPRANYSFSWQESTIPKNGGFQFWDVSANVSSISVKALGTATSQNWPSILTLFPQSCGWLNPSLSRKRTVFAVNRWQSSYPKPCSGVFGIKYMAPMWPIMTTNRPASA